MHYLICILSFICTVIYSPIENDNKPLTMDQKKHFRILGTVLVLLISSVSTVFKATPYNAANKFSQIKLNV